MPRKKSTPTPAPTTPNLNINERVVNVDVPLNISHQKAKMDQVMANVLKHLGCGGCHSGWDIRFRHLRDLAVDAKTLAVNARGAIIER